jgi:uncharacterized protein YndB with AHSA1/START domain
MSVKKEASGRRSIEVEIEVPGTPEEVWQAIATGPGISSWFVPTRMEEHQGGEVTSDFGPGMDGPAKITSWEPPMRFVAENALGESGEPTLASEWTVEARAGGNCLVRVVKSLFSDNDDWDNQLDGLEQGLPTYFRLLRIYLENYRGMPCTAMQFIGFSSDSEAKAWEKLGGALGLVNLAPGKTWSTPTGFPRMAGTIDSRGTRCPSNTVLLKINTPAPGTAYIGALACGGMVVVFVSVYFFGDKAKAAVERDESSWQTWMTESFPMPSEPSESE